MILIIAVYLVYVVGIFFLNYIKSFCFICSPVEHYFCFYLIFFLYEFEMSPGKIVFGVVPRKNDKLCPMKIGLSSPYLSTVKTIIDVPGKVVYLRYTTVYCACLSVVLIARSFLLKLSRMTTLLGKS